MTAIRLLVHYSASRQRLKLMAVVAGDPRALAGPVGRDTAAASILTFENKFL
jgi:hypothetical protein